MLIIQWTLFISNSQELQARGCLRGTVCVMYDLKWSFPGIITGTGF